MRNRRLLLALIAVLGVILPVLAADMTCSVCGKRITGSYMKDSNGRVYCSKRCFRTTLPRCATCNKVIEGRYVESDGRKYCSQECFRHTWPKCDLCGVPVRRYTRIRDHVYCDHCADRPRCSECYLPVGRGVRFTDGRSVCTDCHKELVDEDRARALYEGAQRAIRRITGREVREPPKLDLVDLERLADLWDRPLDENLSIRGFYRHDERWHEFVNGDGEVVRRVHNRTTGVFLLFPQRNDNFRASAVHELFHHVQAFEWPKLHDSPLWVQEGLCQYVAATYCRQHKLANPLHVIENSPDAVYGDGYRWFAATFGPDNWPAVARWLETLDPTDLPESAPRTYTD